MSEKDEKTLSEFERITSTFITIEDGKSYTGIYKGYKIVEKDFKGTSNTYARYLLEDPVDGITRNFDSRSGSLARQFNKIAKGETVIINRTGERLNTKWMVKIADKTVKEKSQADLWAEGRAKINSEKIINNDVVK